MSQGIVSSLTFHLSDLLVAYIVFVLEKFGHRKPSVVCSILGFNSVLDEKLRFCLLS